MLKRFNINRTFVNNESGAALVVESSIVYPIVFVCLLFLIMISLIFVQKATLQSDAEKAAEYIARSISYEGYSNVMKLTSNGIEYNDNLTKEDVTLLLTDEYLYDAFTETTINLQKCENEIEQIASEHNFFRMNKIDCTIEVNNNVMNKSVTVTIKNSLGLSDLFGRFGLIDEFYYEVSAVASIGSPSEFVRDVDFVNDFGTIVNGEALADKITNFILAMNK